MSASRAATRPESDQRLLALLFLGLFLCVGPQLFRSVFPPQTEQKPAPSAYLWLAGAGLSEGLYRLETGKWPAVSSATPAELPPAAGLAAAASSGPAAFHLQAKGPPVPVRPPAGLAPLFFAPININEADRELLMILPGIGPKLTDAIIALRRQRGRFKELPELLDVNGIGKGKIAKLEGRVFFD